MNELPQIRGIKLSTELMLMRIPPDCDPPPAEIIRRLATEKINLTCVVLERVENRLAGVFCIDTEDLPAMQQVVADMGVVLEEKKSVGTLTLFPYRGQLELLAATLRAVASRHMPLLAMASTFSTLTIALPYQRLDEAVAAIARFVRLPANHTPMRPQFRVKQV